MSRFQKVSKKVADKLSQSKAVIVVAGSAVLATSSQAAAIVMPAPDYTDIQSAATIGFGVALTVGLLMKAKSFFR